MAIVRCGSCGLNHSRTTRDYVTTVKPLGYPDTAVICGLRTCKNPGVVWLEQEEFRQYERGERVFRIPSYATKIKVE